MRAIKSLAVVLALLAGSFVMSAQNRTVSGTVTDANQQPLVGVAVIQFGTSNGVMTDVDGRYSIAVPSQEVVLEFSSLGYATTTVTVPAAQAVANAVLAEDNMLLEETVVVGYGTQKKVNLTGAITTVSPKDLEDRSSHSLSNMLQGSVPGLNVSTSAGGPGATASINIRGITSINSADPIVLIDGAIGDLNRVNPNDVASISVIKDAAAAAVYGARAAYGVILVTTKSGESKDGKATVRYSGRFGWEEPTTSTDYETSGYWSVYTVNKFWMADSGTNYCNYTNQDMMQLLARVNDKTENPDRPWVIEEVRNGKKQWVYYCNTDWWHELYRDQHPTMNQSISVSGGTKNIKYFVSGAYDRQVGMIKVAPDIYQKYNLRAKIDAKINKLFSLSNNTSYYSSVYNYQGVGDINNAIAYSARHGLACFPLKNPDGSWLYSTPYLGYKVANGRHIVFGNGHNANIEKKNDFANTTELTFHPVKQFNVKANFTFRQHGNYDTHRGTRFDYREYPDGDIAYYTTGAGEDYLEESVKTWNYIATNVFGTYEDTFNDAHHITAMVGFNYETQYTKYISATGKNLLSEELNDLSLTGPDASGAIVTIVDGSQTEYALMGFFGRVNYDYKGRYLVEVSGRYDGTSRFAEGHRWGFFPSASAGWRISEEPFFAPAKSVVSNLKIRASFGSLGNQNVSNYAYLRTVSLSDFKYYNFGDGNTVAKYSSLSAPNASDLTWETTYQYNLGVDASFLDGRLDFTGEAYIRDTKNMLTAGIALPSVYGASSPKMNAADLRTKGFELSLGWRDGFKLAGYDFNYNLRGSVSNYVSHITKFDNPEKSFAKTYYEGMRFGDIWGFEVDGLFKTDEEAKDYTTNVLDCGYIKNRMTGGWMAGDLKYVDLDGDKVLGVGANTVDDPGDRKILGNSLPSLQYGINAGFSWAGVDVSVFFQGTGNHYWYPDGMNMAFWGCYSYPYTTFMQKGFINKCWSENNPDAYFPRPRAYSATGGELSKVNSMYLQNIRYLRFKNLTVGYSLPKKATDAMHMEKIRVYFTGENLCYWSPLKKNSEYLDPESCFGRSNSNYDNAYYPWAKTLMFGIDITF